MEDLWTGPEVTFSEVREGPGSFSKRERIVFSDKAHH
jgi:hypothetical protein